MKKQKIKRIEKDMPGKYLLGYGQKITMRWVGIRTMTRQHSGVLSKFQMVCSHAFKKSIKS